jgi:hypothetical protein
MMRSAVGFIVFASLAACSPGEAPAPASPPSLAAAPGGTPAPALAPAEAASTEATPVPSPQIAGGYGSADLDSADAKAALALATAELYQKFPQRALVEKTSAEVQVVAGLNYRFDIQMTGGKHYTAVVYKPLQGAMTVSSVEEAN